MTMKEIEREREGEKEKERELNWDNMEKPQNFITNMEEPRVTITIIS